MPKQTGPLATRASGSGVVNLSSPRPDQNDRGTRNPTSTRSRPRIMMGKVDQCAVLGRVSARSLPVRTHTNDLRDRLRQGTAEEWFRYASSVGALGSHWHACPFRVHLATDSVAERRLKRKECTPKRSVSQFALPLEKSGSFRSCAHFVPAGSLTVIRFTDERRSISLGANPSGEGASTHTKRSPADPGRFRFVLSLPTPSLRISCSGHIVPYVGLPSDSYLMRTAPLSNPRDSMSLNRVGSTPSGKRRLPLPRMTG